jgi:hypothetical protein
MHQTSRAFVNDNLIIMDVSLKFFSKAMHQTSRAFVNDNLIIMDVSLKLLEALKHVMNQITAENTAPEKLLS